MIRNLTVKRCRRLADVTLPVVTVRLLNGPNAAGKSNLIDALRLPAEAVRADTETAVTRRGGLRGVFFLGAREQSFAIGLEYFVPDPSAPHSRSDMAYLVQVPIARLIGYRWHEYAEGGLGDLTDGDITCILPVRGEQPGATWLEEALTRAYGDEWKAATLEDLLEQVSFKGKTLEDWLRDGFFEQHCRLFHQRPFIWHIWDGRRRGGFGALVNYYKLDRRCLERLAYTHLGEWIEQRRQGARASHHGAEDRLVAALELQKKLALILEGEPPFDISVRWKPIKEQPIGWEPDLNDGVRVNIRPFVEAGVLRKDPQIGWTKDRGSEPQRPQGQYPWFWKGGEFTGERVNDVHLTNAEKRAAREQMAGAGYQVAGGASTGSDSRGGRS